MTTKKKFLLFGGIGAAIVLLVALNAAAQRDKGTEVRLETVQRRPLVATVTASGQIQPQRAVDISSDITGRIIQIPVEEGDTVTRGQLLLRIDPSQYEAAVARAQAMLASAEAGALQARVNRDQARRALDRTLELRRDSTLISDEQMEQVQTTFDVAEATARSAEHQVEQARAATNEAQEQLAKTVIRAPMSGELTRLAVEEGETAVPGTFSRETGLLMTVSDLSVIQVNVRVDETDVVRITRGDSTEITIDAFPDTAFAGRVTKIAQSAVRTAATSAGATNQAVDYEVEVTLEDPPAGIRPDLSATAKIVTATRDSALSIPIIALTVREHQPISTEVAPQDTARTQRETEGVFVVRQGVARFVPVRVGIAGEEHFEVLSGLAEGDSIVAGPYQTIRDLKDSTAVKASDATTATPR
jgi:HlyD family secretion protein